MTEADPTGPSRAEAEPQPPPAAPQPTEPPAPKPQRSKRSNEFYLALAGIAATVVVGLVGALLAYQASARQVAAESERSALVFGREQRKVAYTEFLNALSDLDRAEFNIRYAIDPSLGGGPDTRQLEDQYDDYTEATDNLNRAASAVRLLASPDVASAREAIRDEHSNIFMKINTLMEAADRGDPANVLDDLRRQVGLASTELEERFIDAAKKDLGVTE